MPLLRSEVKLKRVVATGSRGATSANEAPVVPGAAPCSSDVGFAATTVAELLEAVEAGGDAAGQAPAVHAPADEAVADTPGGDTGEPVCDAGAPEPTSQDGVDAAVVDVNADGQAAQATSLGDAEAGRDASVRERSPHTLLDEAVVLVAKTGRDVGGLKRKARVVAQETKARAAVHDMAYSALLEDPDPEPPASAPAPAPVASEPSICIHEVSLKSDGPLLKKRAAAPGGEVGAGTRARKRFACLQAPDPQESEAAEIQESIAAVTERQLRNQLQFSARARQLAHRLQALADSGQTSAVASCFTNLEEVVAQTELEVQSSPGIVDSFIKKRFEASPGKTMSSLEAKANYAASFAALGQRSSWTCPVCAAHNTKGASECSFCTFEPALEAKRVRKLAQEAAAESNAQRMKMLIERCVASARTISKDAEVVGDAVLLMESVADKLDSLNRQAGGAR